MRRTIFTFIMLCFITLTLQAQDVWTAAGSSTIFGSHWNETDTSNDLTDKGNGIWELTFTFNQATKEVSATAVPSVTDGISQIASDIKTKKVIFNLQGQRISAPKQGVYIINGKKITNTYHSNHQKGIHQHRECLFLDNFPRFFRIFHL